MKPRHWQALMDLTGVIIDASLRSLTLQNIFNMELFAHRSEVEEIVNEAVQEAKIESELQKIETYWRTSTLTLVKYKKNGNERGLILRPSDELKADLEDNMVITKLHL